MLEEMLVRHCAPTLAGLKTGSLFACRFHCQEELMREIRCINSRLGTGGVRVLPLRYEADKWLVYVFRPERLQKELDGQEACWLLAEQGYAGHQAGLCLAQLRRRLAQGEEFPHEIGLFLGYPAEDVAGFIHRRGQEKYAGQWKVFGDVEAAQRRFARYKKCTEVYLSQYALGSTLERLTVIL